jgi:hypothetical protein
MRDLAVLFPHLLATGARLTGPGSGASGFVDLSVWADSSATTTVQPDAIVTLSLWFDPVFRHYALSHRRSAAPTAPVLRHNVIAGRTG